jgi:coniferyl-aldehyde dehydrogenase
MRPRPLALYIFDRDRKTVRRVLEQTHSGGACINDTVFQIGIHDMPFGGIGNSGMGVYHGREGFLTFSHAKGVFRRPRINSARLIYTPRRRVADWLLKLFVR